MQNSTKRNKRTGAIVCAAVMVALLALVLAVLVFPLLGANYGETAAVLFLAVYAAMILAVIAGVVIALLQRLREIEKGEEEDAKKY